MNNTITTLTQDLSINEKLSDQDFDKTLSEIELKFPIDYLEFMRSNNGGEGSLGNAYASFWRWDELIETNKQYKVDEFAPDLFIVGSDGGDTAFAFKKDEGFFTEVPFIGMSDFPRENRGNSFSEFLLFLANDYAE